MLQMLSFGVTEHVSRLLTQTQSRSELAKHELCRKLMQAFEEGKMWSHFFEFPAGLLHHISPWSDCIQGSTAALLLESEELPTTHQLSGLFDHCYCTLSLLIYILIKENKPFKNLVSRLQRISNPAMQQHNLEPAKVCTSLSQLSPHLCLRDVSPTNPLNKGLLPRHTCLKKSLQGQHKCLQEDYLITVCVVST